MDYNFFQVELRTALRRTQTTPSNWSRYLALTACMPSKRLATIHCRHCGHYFYRDSLISPSLSILHLALLLLLLPLLMTASHWGNQPPRCQLTHHARLLNVTSFPRHSHAVGRISNISACSLVKDNNHEFWLVHCSPLVSFEPRDCDE